MAPEAEEEEQDHVFTKEGSYVTAHLDAQYNDLVVAGTRIREKVHLEIGGDVYKRDKNAVSCLIDRANQIFTFSVHGRFYQVFKGSDSSMMMMLGNEQKISHLTKILTHIGPDTRVARYMGKGIAKDRRDGAILMERPERLLWNSDIGFPYMQPVLVQLCEFLITIAKRGMFWDGFTMSNLGLDKNATILGNIIKIIGMDGVIIVGDDTEMISSDLESQMSVAFGNLIQEMIPDRTGMHTIEELILQCLFGHIGLTRVLELLKSDIWIDRYFPDAVASELVELEVPDASTGGIIDAQVTFTPIFQDYVR
eukprot:gene6572-7622_t